jgi:hypothetical protein
MEIKCKMIGREYKKAARLYHSSVLCLEGQQRKLPAARKAIQN